MTRHSIRSQWLGLLAMAFSAAPAMAEGGATGREADLALVNGRIYTAQDWQPWARAVAIAGDRIVYVGDPAGEEWKAAVGPHTRIVDLKGRLAVPGLIDSHTHPEIVSSTTWHTILPWTMSPDEQLTYLQQWAKAHPKQPVIYAEYYPTQMFGPTGPHRELIDRYLPDRAVIWEDFTDHAACLNSKALRLMGIDRNTPDPQPGTAYFVRDAAGNPSGWVKEGAYLDYLPKMFAAVHWTPPDGSEIENLGRVVDDLSSYGVVAVFDAWATEKALATVASLDRQHRLNMYYEAAIRFDKLSELPERIAEVRRWQTRYGSQHVRINTLKLFLDGTNEIATSALLEPFANDPTRSGEPTMSKEDLIRSMVMLNDAGLDIHIHMTGDKTFRLALDAVQAARRELGDRWHLQVTFAHCELISDQDFARVAPLGVMINWSPHWSGGYFQGPLETLGQARYDELYRFQPIISSGGIVTFGSDTTSLYEWSRANPYLGMQIAHTRLDTDARYALHGPKKPLSEQLQMRDLLNGYTRNGAVQLRLADRLGTIEAGKLASIVVLDQDLFGVPSEKIQNTKAEAVIFEGRVVKGALSGSDGRERIN
jgi:predicted amidohydrolase YtcJ